MCYYIKLSIPHQIFVVSRKDFISRFIKGGVYKLNTEKIKCIIREKERGELSTGEIASILLSLQEVWELKSVSIKYLISQ